jgi:tight adherence protein B
MIFIFSLTIGICAAAFVWALFILEKDLNPSILSRLERIKHKSNAVADAKNLEVSFSDSEYQFQAIGEFIRTFKLTEKIKEMIKLADVNMYPDTFILISFLCGLPFLIFLLTPIKWGAILAIPAVFMPTAYIKQLISKRYMEFAKQFPDALNLMASSLRAGHPLFSAIDIVTDQMPKPISDVFSTAQKDIALGIDTKEAFLSMTHLMPESIDLRFFITAVLIQNEVGGNLAELLDKLSGTIRERFKLLGQLRVQTAQTRISGLVLGFVPVALLLLISFMNPEYMKPLFETQQGQIAFVCAIGLMIGGFISIKKISNIEM